MERFFRYLLYTLLAGILLITCISVVRSKPKSPTKPIIKDKQVPSMEFIARTYVKGLHALQFDNRRFCSASNISYKGKQYVLTNMHCCMVAAQLGNPNKMVVGDKVSDIIKIDSEADLCVLSSDRADGIELAASVAKPLDKVVLIGHPRGMPLVIREGRIIGDEKACVDYGPFIGPLCRVATRISALAYPGNSGSPVLNSSMELVGVLFAGDGMYPNEPIIVPLDQVKRFLDSL